MSPAEMPPDGKAPAKKATPAKKTAPPKRQAPAKKNAPAKKTAPVKKKAPTKRPPAKKKAPAKKRTPTTKASAKKRAPAARKAPASQHTTSSDDAALQRADVEMKPGPVVHEVPEAARSADDPWNDDWGDIGWDEPGVGEGDWGSDDERDEAGAWSKSEGADRFQAAARDLIDAARAMLDAAEEAVADPHVFRSALGSLRGFADDVFRFASQANPMARGPHSDEPDDPDDFQHIPVD